MGKYTSLARTLRDEPGEADFGEGKGNTQRNTYVNINTSDKRKDSNPPAKPSGTVTTLRPTTLTTLIESENHEKRSVVCIHSLEPDACAVCSGYVRWLIADDSRISAARSDPEAMRRRYRASPKGGAA
jgi:hypothetical protein